ncbi:MAG: AMP-binding protein, partial [Tidjanibacter sp.]|nr:AMP-binding protein [Tidjanibacter sp.]
MKKRTLIDLFEGSVAKYGDNVCMWEKTDPKGKFEPTTYKEVKEIVLKVGGGLASLGIKPKTTVSILSEGRNHWIFSELGLLYAGAISVPLSIKLEESNDLLFRLQHADVELIFVSKQQLPKIRKIREQLPALKHIVVLDNIELEEGEMTFDALTALGEEYLKENREAFLEIGKNIQNDDYATITYTSGTTADPKGVILTHRNYTANVEQSLSCIEIPSTYRTLIILPLDHCFAHVVGFYIMIERGASFGCTQVGRTPMETLKNIPINIKELEPDFLLSVPAIAKNFRKNIENGIRAKGATTEKLFKFALKVSYAYNKDGYTKGSGFSFMLKPLVWLFDKILYAKIRENFGRNLKFFIGGGALLDSELQRFFYAIGIPMFQGYGLSEATPVISTNTPKKHRFGSSGILVSPMELRIKDSEGVDQPLGVQGEIVIKGENVMAGYWKNPTASAETVRDGWLYTGDMGYMGKDGLLYVLGRFKSLLISSDGEKYSPEGMEENFVGQSPYIDNVILYNNQNPYTVMLVVPAKDAVKRYLDQNKVAPENRGKAAVELFQSE